MLVLGIQDSMPKKKDSMPNSSTYIVTVLKFCYVF